MVGAATVFVVRDMTRSIEHSRDALGFTVTFQYGNPTFYACLSAVTKLRCTCSRRTKPNGCPAMAAGVFVKDVDRVHADLTARGANAINAPRNYDYGMRDFDVVDPDGNQLTFGMEFSPPHQTDAAFPLEREH